MVCTAYTVSVYPSLLYPTTYTVPDFLESTNFDLVVNHSVIRSWSSIADHVVQVGGYGHDMGA